MSTKSRFKNSLAENVFRLKYAQGPDDSWDQLAERLVEDVCGTRWGKDRPLMSEPDRKQLVEYIKEMKFLPGGRYIYYAGRPNSYFNNCFLLRGEEDTREEWGALAERSMSCLTTGGGIGIDYSAFRPEGKTLTRTGGKSSGPIPLMFAINEIGRSVMQGGSRRSAIYASLNWKHEDISKFLTVKNWENYPVGDTGLSLKDIKEKDFNFAAPLDMTNISVNYDDAWLNLEDRHSHPVFLENVRQAMRTGEPGFSFNFGDKQNETLRNAPVSDSTRVLTKDGYKTVKSIINIPTKIWTGKQWAIATFTLTAESVGTVTVTLSNGRSITCSPEHPFIVWTKQGEKRVPAIELKMGSSISSDLPQDANHSSSSMDYGYGFVFGDGNIRNSRGEISYWVDSKKVCFEKAFQQLGAHTRSISNRAYFASKYDGKVAIKSPEFVAGWFDADGCSTAGRLRLSSTNKDFLVDLSEYLDELGIKSSVREDGVSGYKPSSFSYTLTVFKESHNRFSEIIPTLRVVVPQAGNVRKQNISVVSVEDSGFIEDVYCCDVGVDEHSFMAEGVLISNCTEVTSEDDSDVCNLGSANMGNIKTLEEFKNVVRLGSMFLVCGTLRADLPYDKVYKVREKNRRLGLGLMGIHEWLLQRKYGYVGTPELHEWLAVYRDESEIAADAHCERLYISKPAAYRAIAPTGSIGILAGTSTGIEPLFAVAYKRRYLTDGTKWKYEYVVDSTADLLIREHDLDPNTIDTAYSLSGDFEKRIKFQADIQDYVDMSISSTINLPSWGTKGNNEDRVADFALTLSKYAHRLRGFTAYPDGSRGGQPITECSYEEAMKHKGVVFEEHAECKNGVCGI